MNRTMLWTLLTLAVLVVACAPRAPSGEPQPTAPAPSAPSTPEPSAPPVVVTPPPATVDYAMTDATRAKVEKGLTSTTKYFLSETFRQIAYGSHHTFGIGFTNRLQKADKFIVEAEFKRAYDKSGNTLDKVVAAQVAPWLAENDWSVVSLDPGEQKIEPIVVVVRDFADGSAPPKGTYEFTIRVLNQENFPDVSHEYSGDLTIAVQVQ